ncbi:MAG: YybH family protein [Gemmatimonadales bacterium]
MEVGRSLRLCAYLPVVALAASACRGSVAAPADAMAAVRATDSALQAAIAYRDLDRTLSFYANDAFLLPAAAPIVVGRDAIRAEWTKLFAIPAFNSTAQLAHVDVAESGDLAYTRGTYETRLTGQDGQLVTERGKWVSIWRKQPDGTWRIVVDIYNTDTPPPDHI